MKPLELRDHMCAVRDKRQRSEQRALQRVGLLFMSCSALSACLPVEATSPDCFPAEPCPRGLLCVEGRCETPPIKRVKVSFSCLSSPACLERLDTRGSGARDRAEGGALCLIIEQAHQLSAHALNLSPDEPQELMIPLSESALRSSLVWLSSTECPTTERELSRRALDLTCVSDLNCVIRLRHPQLSSQDMSSNELELNFTGALGQCLDVSWSADAPQERCDGLDDDCDGFVDEGVSCL